jgi:hypothetical protein
MADGVLVTVAFPPPAPCPVARATEGTDTVVRASSSAPGEPVTEFLVDAPEPPTLPQPAPSETASADQVDPVFSYGRTHVYRLRHGGGDCPCARLGDAGCPIHAYHAEAGRLTLRFHVADFEQLQSVVAALRETYPEMDIRRLLQSPAADPPGTDVFVDRGRLTARQLEVLRTAYEMGYFQRPRRTNATAVATELGITPSTFSEHLAAGQRKLLGDVLEATP